MKEAVIPPSEADLIRVERVQQEVISGITPGLGDHLRGWKLRLAASLGEVLGLLYVACGSAGSSKPGNIEAPAIINPEKPAEIAPVDIPVSKEPVATVEAQKPAAPEAKIVGNGAIVPEELSTTGVMREFEYQGQVYKLALYNLPDGTPITAPKDGYFVARQAGGNPFIGSHLSVFNPVDLTVPNIGLRGSLQVVNRFSRNVKAGEVVAYIQDTEEKMFGEYNFVIWVSALDANSKFFSPEEPYKEYLPNLPKGPRIVQTQPVQPSSSGNVYLPKAN